jgi:hypothetical protein
MMRLESSSHEFSQFFFVEQNSKTEFPWLVTSSHNSNTCATKRAQNSECHNQTLFFFPKVPCLDHVEVVDWLEEFEQGGRTCQRFGFQFLNTQPMELVENQ